MDTFTQIALGSAVGIAVMGKRTSLAKAALWGAVCGTLPDLDVLIDHGDPIRDMTFHRAGSHSLFWLTLAAPALAWLISKIHREQTQFPRWCLAVWLVLVTHPLLDLMTVYGTQLGQPFTDRPFGVGSIFVIDPLYTLPLVIGVLVALRGRTPHGLRWNAAGLLLSTLYLGWSFAAQQLVRVDAEASLRAQGIHAESVLVTPTAFNTVLWRVVAMSPSGYHEGVRSLLDRDTTLHVESFPRGEALHAQLQDQWPVARMAWFSRGFFKVSQDGDQALITDLRMGQEPHYTFSFVVARKEAGHWVAAPVQNVGSLPEIGPSLRWLWTRALGNPTPPPR